MPVREKTDIKKTKEEASKEKAAVTSEMKLKKGNKKTPGMIFPVFFYCLFLIISKSPIR